MNWYICIHSKRENNCLCLQETADFYCSEFNVVVLLSATRTSSQVTFPVDFFEHNQQLTEVEFGGNDLLQVYNGQQIKHRLNSTGMYVANTKVGQFIKMIH